MKMIMVMYRHSLDHLVRETLTRLGVKAFTEAPKVYGSGEAGHAEDSFEWPTYNSMILSALEDEQADHVIKGLTSFRDDLSRKQKGEKIPMRAFILPCEQVL
jgi:hypothetical protein